MPHTIKTLLLLLLSFSIVPAWAADDEAEAAPQAIYYQFPAKPPIRIDFSRQSNKEVSLLQVEVALMSHDQEIISLAKTNLPMLQHSIRRLLSKQNLASVSTLEGRTALQAKALATINTILKEESGKEGIEGFFFTSFILQ